MDAIDINVYLSTETMTISNKLKLIEINSNNGLIFDCKDKQT